MPFPHGSRCRSRTQSFARGPVPPIVAVSCYLTVSVPVIPAASCPSTEQ
jgi:hypothetical protein